MGTLPSCESLNAHSDLREFRAKVLASYGADVSETEALLAYSENTGLALEQTSVLEVPLPSEPHLMAWEQYAAEAAEQGVFAVLKRRLPQLQFPIAAGISETAAYRSATRRGISPLDSLATGLVLRQPETLQLWLHPTLAGTIPVLVVSDRQDFVALVQAFTLRNEPNPVPDSMGACIVAGFNNWDRIRHYRQQWAQQHPGACSEAHWNLEFRRITPQKALYQDRFILLSAGPYSNVAASKLGLADEEWHQLSLVIRLEHECTHYLTRRLFGFMRNNILDELLADYRGLVAATGDYRADWFLWFLGLEAYPAYREGGRLQNYRGQPPLSTGAFQVLQGLVKDAAENLKRAHCQWGHGLKPGNDQVRWLRTLTQLTLEELADVSAIARLEQLFHTSGLSSSSDRSQPTVEATNAEPC